MLTAVPVLSHNNVIIPVKTFELILNSSECCGILILSISSSSFEISVDVCPNNDFKYDAKKSSNAWCTCLCSSLLPPTRSTILVKRNAI